MFSVQLHKNEAICFSLVIPEIQISHIRYVGEMRIDGMEYSDILNNRSIPYILEFINEFESAVSSIYFSSFHDLTIHHPSTSTSEHDHVDIICFVSC